MQTSVLKEQRKATMAKLISYSFICPSCGIAGETDPVRDERIPVYINNWHCLKCDIYGTFKRHVNSYPPYQMIESLEINTDRHGCHDDYGGGYIEGLNHPRMSEHGTEGRCIHCGLGPKVYQFNSNGEHIVEEWPIHKEPYKKCPCKMGSAGI